MWSHYKRQSHTLEIYTLRRQAHRRSAYTLYTHKRRDIYCLHRTHAEGESYRSETRERREITHRNHTERVTSEPRASPYALPVVTRLVASHGWSSHGRAVVTRSIVAQSVVTRPVVTRSVVMRLVVMRPVVMRPVGRSAGACTCEMGSFELGVGGSMRRIKSLLASRPARRSAHEAAARANATCDGEHAARAAMWKGRPWRVQSHGVRGRSKCDTRQGVRARRSAGAPCTATALDETLMCTSLALRRRHVSICGTSTRQSGSVARLVSLSITCVRPARQGRRESSGGSGFEQAEGTRRERAIGKGLKRRARAHDAAADIAISDCSEMSLNDSPAESRKVGLASFKPSRPPSAGDSDVGAAWVSSGVPLEAFCDGALPPRTLGLLEPTASAALSAPLPCVVRM